MNRLSRGIQLLGLSLVLAVFPTLASAQTSGEGVTATATSGASDDAEATTETSGAEAATTSAGLDGSTYRVRLRDLEQSVDELKEQIRRSHTRLSLLSDTILSGAMGGARAEIEFVNDLSGAWRVVEAVFVLDGAVQYKKTDDTGVLAAQKNIPIFSGSVPTGDHTLQVLLKLRGHGFGVFSYLRGIEATVRHDHSFTVTDGKVFQLRATAWERGGPTTPLEEQPDIRFSEGVRNLSDPTTSSKESATPAGAAVETSVSSTEGGGEAGASATIGGGN